MAVNVKGRPLWWSTGMDNSGLKKGSAEAHGILGNLKGQVSKLDIFAGLGVGAVAMFAAIAKRAFDFAGELEYAMLEVKTVSKGFQDDFEGMGQKIIDMSKTVPESAIGLTKAMYQIQSAGYDGAKAFEILEASTKGAVAGLTTTETVANAITSVMNAYGASAGNAARISDILFTVVKLGKVRMEELAPAIMQVTGLAAQAGMSFEDLAASFALGAKTLPIRFVSTGVKGILTAIISPTTDAIKEVQRLNGEAKKLKKDTFDFSVAGFQQQGMGGFLAGMMKLTDGNIEALARIFPNIRGLIGLLAVAGEEGKKFAKTQEQVKASLGATEAAFEIMMESHDNLSKVFQNNINAMLKPLGSALDKGAGDILKALNKAFDAGTVDRILKSLGAVANVVKIVGVAFLAAKIPLLIWTGIMRGGMLLHKAYEAVMYAFYAAQTIVTKGWKAYSSAAGAAGIASKMNAIGAAIGVVTALAMAISALSKEHKKYKAIEENEVEFKQKLRDETADEIDGLEKLTRAIGILNPASAERGKMIKEFNEKYGQYLTNLLGEKAGAEEVAAAYKQVNAELRETIRLRNLNEKSSALSKVAQKATDERIAQEKLIAGMQPVHAVNISERGMGSMLTDLQTKDLERAQYKLIDLQKNELAAKTAYEESLKEVDEATFAQAVKASEREMNQKLDAYEKIKVLNEAERKELQAASTLRNTLTKQLMDAETEQDKKAITEKIAINQAELDKWDKIIKERKPAVPLTSDQVEEALKTEGNLIDAHYTNLEASIKKYMGFSAAANAELKLNELNKLRAIIDLNKKYGQDITKLEADLALNQVDFFNEQAKLRYEAQAKKLEDSSKLLHTKLDKTLQDLSKQQGKPKLLITEADQQAATEYLDNYLNSYEGMLKQLEEKRAKHEITDRQFDEERSELDVKYFAAKVKVASQFYRLINGLNLTQLVDLRKQLDKEIAMEQDAERKKELIKNRSLTNIEIAQIGLQALMQTVKDLAETLGVASEELTQYFDWLGKMGSATAKVASGDILGGVLEAGQAQVEKWSKMVMKYYQILNKYQRNLMVSQMKLNLVMAGIDAGTGNTQANLLAERAAQQDVLNASTDEYNRLLNKNLQTEGRLKKEIELAAQIAGARDAINSINETLTQTTAQSIAAGIVQGFEDGKDASTVFSENFNQLMLNAIRSAVITSLTESEEMQIWVKEFTWAMRDGIIDANEDLGLQKDFQAIVDKGKQYTEALNRYLGKPAGTTTTTANGEQMQNAIKGITEESASLLVGQFNAMRVNVGKQLDVMNTSMGYLKNISQNSDHLKRLEVIEKKLTGGSLISSGEQSLGG